jgi:hypothetical protein
MRIPVSILVVLLFSSIHLSGQEVFMDALTTKLLDSLETRITVLERELPRLAETRAPSWFFKKRELDYTLFLREYHRYLFDEDLDEAQRLVHSRLVAARKRGDNDAISFYTEYQQRIAREIGNQQRRYQSLFAKEKNFRREFDKFLDAGDEYSLQRAIRMTDLAIKYARERNLQTVLEYLYSYKKVAEAAYYDLNSEYDLSKLTSSEAFFFKTFNPLLKSDSLEMILEAGKLVENCLAYDEKYKTILGKDFFIMQQKVVNTSISDYYERKGNMNHLATLGGQLVVARMDTLNREGIYKWHDNIIVIGHFTPDSRIDNVKKGEAIMAADQKLMEYIRVNRLAKLGKAVEFGSTALIPYIVDRAQEDFCFNPEVMKYQYRICYSKVESLYLTRQISKFLPPLQFDIEMGTP